MLTMFFSHWVIFSHLVPIELIVIKKYVISSLLLQLASKF